MSDKASSDICKDALGLFSCQYERDSNQFNSVLLDFEIHQAILERGTGVRQSFRINFTGFVDPVKEIIGALTPLLQPVDLPFPWFFA